MSIGEELSDVKAADRSTASNWEAVENVPVIPITTIKTIWSSPVPPNHTVPRHNTVAAIPATTTVSPDPSDCCISASSADPTVAAIRTERIIKSWTCAVATLTAQASVTTISTSWAAISPEACIAATPAHRITAVASVTATTTHTPMTGIGAGIKDIPTKSAFATIPSHSGLS